MAAGKVKGTPGTQPGTNLNIVTGVNEGPCSHSTATTSARRSEESGLKRLAQENTGCRFFSFFFFVSPPRRLRRRLFLQIFGGARDD